MHSLFEVHVLNSGQAKLTALLVIEIRTLSSNMSGSDESAPLLQCRDEHCNSTSFGVMCHLRGVPEYRCCVCGTTRWLKTFYTWKRKHKTIKQLTLGSKFCNRWRLEARRSLFGQPRSFAIDFPIEEEPIETQIEEEPIGTQIEETQIEEEPIEEEPIFRMRCWEVMDAEEAAPVVEHAEEAAPVVDAGNEPNCSVDELGCISG